MSFILRKEPPSRFAAAPLSRGAKGVNRFFAPLSKGGGGASRRGDSVKLMTLDFKGAHI